MQARFFSLLLVGGFLTLTVRLIDVSLIRGGYYQSLSQENRIRKIPLFAPRGQIYDRNGVAMAVNEEKKRIVRFEAGKAIEVRNVSGENDLEVDTAKETVVVYPKRVYPAKEASAHVVGYVGETAKEEIGQMGCPETSYSMGDVVGRFGAEQAFDCTLRGKNGEELVEVDTRGRKIRILGKIEPKVGNDVNLLIDLSLQKKALAALEGKKGAIVALKPDTGEVLALVSSPSFDPNILATSYSLLSTDPNLLLFNRAIGGVYPPGSTFKIVTSAAGLEEEKIDENFRFIDEGFIKAGDFTFRNWYFTKFGQTEGEIDLVRAIARSTDTFFYKVGELVGVEKLAVWAQKFGLGKKTDIEIAGETGGIIPTPEWKERVRGERWFLGNTYHMSIGQGDITATPLQIAMMTSVIANNGKWCRPTIRKLENGNSLETGDWKLETCRNIGLSQKTVELIRQGMEMACSPQGTSFRFNNFKVARVYCKTGTAEFGGSEDTHAWFTAFASRIGQDGRVSDPEIVVTVLVERGGEGSTIAAPIAKEVLEEWFRW